MSGLSFAPVFFLPALITLAPLCWQVQSAKTLRQAGLLGFVYGTGHFLTSMYWICIGVSVYEQFWWALPFALLGLPMILAGFISASCAASWLARNNNYYQLIFCSLWVLAEWLRSWLFTGLPWNLLGYSFAFSNLLSQAASVVGVYGLSFIIIYAATSSYYIFTQQYRQLKIALLAALIMISMTAFYGLWRLNYYPTNFSKLRVRLVQASIPQTTKWDVDQFWQDLDAQIMLSQQPGKPDLIIWSEAALIRPCFDPPVKVKLSKMLSKTAAILITGAVAEHNKLGDDFKTYSSMSALDHNGQRLFEYYKSHLVPFGEYMPLQSILPLKKLTPGIENYSAGDGRLVYLKPLNLLIRPLICYEAIFPNLARTSNQVADLIINITNDAWYGRSSGPYQHFEISRFRAIENGLPLIRVANNGLSAVIDPVGRVTDKMALNAVGIIDALCPVKLPSPTLYSQIGDCSALIVALSVLIIQQLGQLLFRNTAGKKPRRLERTF